MAEHDLLVVVDAGAGSARSLGPPLDPAEAARTVMTGTARDPHDPLGDVMVPEAVAPVPHLGFAALRAVRPTQPRPEREDAR